MILEAVNSVCLTYLATEFLLNNNDDNTTPTHGNSSSSTSILQSIKYTLTSQHSKPIQYTFVTVICINTFVYCHDAGQMILNYIHYKLFHIPRILLAICSFLIALYWDCRYKYLQNSNNQSNSTAPWSNRYFIKQLIQSFIRLLPVYPFLAVIISFGFLFVITLFEKLHLQSDILNMPIYYCTLYGPLMMMYWDVKKAVVRSGNVLPR